MLLLLQPKRGLRKKNKKIVVVNYFNLHEQTYEQKEPQAAEKCAKPVLPPVPSDGQAGSERSAKQTISWSFLSPLLYCHVPSGAICDEHFCQLINS